MKRVFLASVALMALTGAAAAADLPPAPAPYYKAPYAAPYYNWTGFYLGVNGGGGFGRSSWDSTGSFDLTGALAGGTIGYNYQYGRAVIGAEGDIDWSGMKGSTTAGCAAGCQTSDSWLSTVRARLGYAADRFLPYVTGGAAFGDIQASRPVLPAAARPMWAGRWAPALNSPSPATGPPRRNISTSTSATSIAASAAERPR